MVIISIISLIFVMCIVLIKLNKIMLIKLFQVSCNLSCPIRARQETNSLRHSYWKYPGKTAGSFSRRHRNHSPPPAQSISGTAGRVPGTDAGCGLSTHGHLDGPAICNESQ
jgi:hypothetical protein